MLCSLPVFPAAISEPYSFLFECLLHRSCSGFFSLSASFLAYDLGLRAHISLVCLPPEPMAPRLSLHWRLVNLLLHGGFLNSGERVVQQLIPITVHQHFILSH